MFRVFCDPHHLTRSFCLRNLSTCLTWVQDKGPREALCNAISEAMTNKNQANLVRALNAYTAKVGDTPDFEVRQEAFSKCTQLVRDAKKFKNVFFTILSNNCFFYLSYVSNDLRKSGT